MALIQPRCPRDKRIGITYKKYANHILKELFRKTIHLCSAFLPYFFGLAKFPFLIALAAVLVIYIISEFLRLNGINIPIISSVTKVAARKRDENKFVIGPVTLCIGIILAELLCEPLPAAIGIYALAFGDGLASLAGKLFGCIQIPLTQGKTAAGSLVCFTAIFISTFAACRQTHIALIIATVGMFVEVLPLKDLDNILIPVGLGGLATILL